MKPKVLSTIIIFLTISSCTMPGTIPATETSMMYTTTPGIPDSLNAAQSPTATGTAIPETRIETGEQALFNGDYITARAEFQMAYNNVADSDLRAAALWGLARTEYEDGNLSEALPHLRELLSAHPESVHVSHANFLLGLIYDQLQRFTEAAAAYEAYLIHAPGLIDAYVHEKRGDSLTKTGEYYSAIDAYQAALAAPRVGDRTALEITIARTYAAAGDSNTALSMYESIALNSDSDYIKAQMDFLSGQLFYNLGLYDQANPYFLHTVNNYPLSYDSYSALVVLENAGIQVDDLNRGLIYYYAGEYGLSLAAFNTYETGNPQNDGNVYYYRGLTLSALGLYEDAILDWSYLIENYYENTYWESAWDEKAFTQWYALGAYEPAAQTLLSFVSAVPNHINAPVYMFDAGRILERAGLLVQSAEVWEDLADLYPESSYVPQALFFAGISRFRSADLTGALVSFQRSLIFSLNPQDQARAYFWIAKTQQALGDSSAAQSAWTFAASLDPNGYYSERAQDVLLDRGFFAPPPAFELSFDLQNERLDAESWIRITFGYPLETDLSSGNLLADPRLRRGEELWKLGLYEESRLEFEALREAVAENPADCYRLANYLYDLGLYRSAIFTARQVLTLAGLNTHTESLTAPAYFTHIRYGPYFQDLILPTAQKKELDPLFLFSVMRQESLFEGFVSSSAGARGLMQIMPATGEIIAENLGWPLDYTSEDLYRPIVNIELGAHELLTNTIHFQGDLFPTLAAYNAGLTSALIWDDLAGGDMDLFLEIVRFQETRNYIRYVYEIYSIYRSLYGILP